MKDHYLDTDTGQPHIYGHGVSGEEVEHVLRHAGEDLPARDQSRQALGQTAAGHYLRVIYVPDPDSESVFVITAYELAGKPLKAYVDGAGEDHERAEIPPPGWDAQRVERLLTHYESLSEEEQVAEDEEAAPEQDGQTVIAVPDDLLPAIRQLLATSTSSTSAAPASTPTNEPKPKPPEPSSPTTTDQPTC